MKNRKAIALVLICVVMCLLLTSCDNDELMVVTSIDELKDARLGVLEGTAFQFVTEKEFPDAQYLNFKTLVDVEIALQQGKIDSFMVDEPIARWISNNFVGLTYLPDMLTSDNYGFCLNSKKAELRTQLNEYITEIKSNGVIDEIQEIWFGTDEDVRVIEDYTQFPDTNGTIEVVLTTSFQPFTYLKDNMVVGYDTDILARFAKKYGYRLNITDITDFGAILLEVETGKSDIAIGCITLTEERLANENFIFTIPDYVGGMVMMVRSTNETIYTKIEQFKGKALGQNSGTVFDKYIKEILPDVTVIEHPTRADGIELLRSKRIEGMMVDEPVGRLITAQNPDLMIVEEPIAPSEYGLALQKGSVYLDEVNAVLQAFVYDGAELCGVTYDELQDYWFSAHDNKKLLDIDFSACNRGVLRVGQDGENEPMGYIGSDGAPMGFEVDLVRIIAHQLNMTADIETVKFDSLIPGLQADKYDITVGSMSITEERKENVDFTVPHYIGSLVIVARSSSEETIGFFDGIANSFHKTFIAEDRYLLILSGIGNTVILSISSAVIGTLVGFGVCLLRLRKSKFLQGIAKVFVWLLQGTPVVVLLLLLYYVVFGSSSINAIYVAIMGFSLNFGAYVSEMIRTGINAVDRGQTEAAYALGFTKVNTFFKIVMPQAIRHILPVYKGEFISMVKMTSIVGYISVQDLTKVSDVIRSRTFEAFFPLIATTLIYFVLIYLLTLVLRYLDRKTDPKRRKVVIKGVER